MRAARVTLRTRVGDDVMSVREVLDALNQDGRNLWSTDDLRVRLLWLDAQCGEKLIRRDSPARNAKWWIVRDELARVWPTRFGPGAYAMSEDDRIRVAEELLKQGLRELADLRREHAREQAALRSEGVRPAKYRQK